jgi:hypothetical protein
MIPRFPKEAKPHEVAILLVYSLGEHTPKGIAEILHYPTKVSVYRAMKKYRDFLPLCRTPRNSFIGPGLITSPGINAYRQLEDYQ